MSGAPLRARSATALVVANMVGVGVFTTSGFALQDLGDRRLVLLAWLVGGGIALCGALCYGALALRFPHSGGEYEYLRRTLHPLAGTATGFVSMFAGCGGGAPAAGLRRAARRRRAAAAAVGGHARDPAGELDARGARAVRRRAAGPRRARQARARRRLPAAVAAARRGARDRRRRRDHLAVDGLRGVDAVDLPRLLGLERGRLRRRRSARRAAQRAARDAVRLRRRHGALPGAQRGVLVVRGRRGPARPARGRGDRGRRAARPPRRTAGHRGRGAGAGDVGHRHDDGRAARLRAHGRSRRTAALPRRGGPRAPARGDRLAGGAGARLPLGRGAAGPDDLHRLDAEPVGRRRGVGARARAPPRGRRGGAVCGLARGAVRVPRGGVVVRPGEGLVGADRVPARARHAAAGGLPVGAIWCAPRCGLVRRGRPPSIRPARGRRRRGLGRRR